MNQTKKKVAVLMGGWSSERDVSLVSGGAVAKALEDLGHQVVPIDVRRALVALTQTLAEAQPDIVFNALHGRYGEDGMIQGVLEIMSLPYTHSGVRASAIAMDKPLMKVVAAQAGVNCAKDYVVTREEIAANGFPLPPPFVVKPPDEGSSVGIALVKTQEEADRLVQSAKDGSWKLNETVMVEAFIPGRELTVAVLGNKGQAKALGVTELRVKSNEFYDYEAKYSAGQTDHLVPAPVPQEIYDEAMRQAVLAYNAAGCQGAARADFRWDESKPGASGLFFLEMNTQPGMTPLSLLPEQAGHAGMDFNALIQWMLDNPTWPA